eukprot:TRINITY_DN52779_c0_g1_i1.p1 TRINITY_DN52779_c0_g1~~TRINITY_DN52779_c0_g1_i1.p1  ORF type:complete len:606 (+),score=28.09 TRINITY_DN52779_c0_g1_i1:74-1819(+)
MKKTQSKYTEELPNPPLQSKKPPKLIDISDSDEEDPKTILGSKPRPVEVFQDLQDLLGPFTSKVSLTSPEKPVSPVLETTKYSFMSTIKCKNGHGLVWSTEDCKEGMLLCNTCNKSCKCKKGRWTCKECEYDVCCECKPSQSLVKGGQRDPVDLGNQCDICQSDPESAFSVCCDCEISLRSIRQKGWKGLCTGKFTICSACKIKYPQYSKFKCQHSYSPEEKEANSYLAFFRDIVANKANAIANIWDWAKKEGVSKDWNTQQNINPDKKAKFLRYMKRLTIYKLTVLITEKGTGSVIDDLFTVENISTIEKLLIHLLNLQPGTMEYEFSTNMLYGISLCDLKYIAEYKASLKTYSYNMLFNEKILHQEKAYITLGKPPSVSPEMHGSHPNIANIVKALEIARRKLKFLLKDKNVLELYKQLNTNSDKPIPALADVKKEIKSIMLGSKIYVRDFVELEGFTSLYGTIFMKAQSLVGDAEVVAARIVCLVVHEAAHAKRYVGYSGRNWTKRTPSPFRMKETGYKEAGGKVEERIWGVSILRFNQYMDLELARYILECKGPSDISAQQAIKKKKVELFRCFIYT